MAVFKVDYGMADGRMGHVFVGDNDTLSGEQVRRLVGEFFPRVGNATRVPTQGITGAKSDGSPADPDTLIINTEDGVWTTYTLLTQWPDDEAEMFGTDSDRERMLEAGVDRGYEQHIAEMQSRLDEDDLARIATALKIAWQNGISSAQGQVDPDMAEVMKGMAGSYSQTLEKIERMLDAGE